MPRTGGGFAARAWYSRPRMGRWTGTNRLHPARPAASPAALLPEASAARIRGPGAALLGGAPRCPCLGAGNLLTIGNIRLVMLRMTRLELQQRRTDIPRDPATGADAGRTPSCGLPERQHLWLEPAGRLRYSPPSTVVKAGSCDGREVAGAANRPPLAEIGVRVGSWEWVRATAAGDRGKRTPAASGVATRRGRCAASPRPP